MYCHHSTTFRLLSPAQWIHLEFSWIHCSCLNYTQSESNSHRRRWRRCWWGRSEVFLSNNETRKLSCSAETFRSSHIRLLDEKLQVTVGTPPPAQQGSTVSCCCVYAAAPCADWSQIVWLRCERIKLLAALRRLELVILCCSCWR